MDKKSIESYETDVLGRWQKERPKWIPQIPYYDPIGPFHPGEYVDVNMKKHPPSEWKRFAPFTIKQLGSCGAIEIYSSSNVTKYSKKRFLQFMNDYFNSNGYTDPENHSKWSNGGLLIAFVNAARSAESHGYDAQVLYKQWLLKVGFESKQIFINHIHGTTLELLTFQMPKDLRMWKWIPEEKEKKILPPKKKKAPVLREVYI